MKKIVCIVEDDVGIREMIEYILTLRGYIVFCCPNVQSFRVKIKTTLPDLVILDVMLPDGSGPELGKELIHNKLTRHIPILFMTANLKFSLPDEFSAQDFIRKPFDLEEFEKKIDILLQKGITPGRVK